MKQLVLLHKYLETGFVSIVCFSDSYSDIWDALYSHPRYSSNRHAFLVTCNLPGNILNVPCFRKMNLDDIKDSCLINICKNVADYLAIGEYAMLKKSYSKSAAWFEKAKNSASLGAEIIDNY